MRRKEILFLYHHILRINDSIMLGQILWFVSLFSLHLLHRDFKYFIWPELFFIQKFWIWIFIYKHNWKFCFLCFSLVIILFPWKYILVILTAFLAYFYWTTFPFTAQSCIIWYNLTIFLKFIFTNPGIIAQNHSLLTNILRIDIQRDRELVKSVNKKYKHFLELRK